MASTAAETIQGERLGRRAELQTASLPGGYSERVPPDTIPNSEVKPFSADDSAAFAV